MSKRKQYEQNSLISAVSDVKRRRLTLSKAARDYGVPRKTIEDHVKGRVKMAKPGIPPMLTDEEEHALYNYMEYMHKHGFPLTRAMLKCYVIAIVRQAGRENATRFNMETGPSSKWIRKFKEKYPALSEKIPQQQDKSRASMSNMTVMNQYFKLLQDAAEELNLLDKPGEIFNCDESGFSGQEQNREKVFSFKGLHSYQQKVLTNGHITVHMCVSADGRVLPSFLIFQGGLPNRNFKDGMPGSWLYGSSDSGYMDSELFERWFVQIFLTCCGSRRPIILTLDNHDSHISINVIKLARENDVHLICLPPHTTHILQPLDVDIFGPLKKRVRKLATSLGHLRKSTVIGKAKFPILLSTAIDQVCSPAQVKGAFRKSGMYPVNLNAIDQTYLLPNETKQTESVPSNDIPTDTLQPSEPVVILCHGCGTSLTIDQAPPTNPLVSQGLIPSSLADILLPPANDVPKKKSKKTVTKARVISGDEMLNKLITDKEAEVQKEQEKKKRKEEREKKRTDMQRIREEKRLVREQKAAQREQQRQEREKRKQERRQQRPTTNVQAEDVNLTVYCIVCGRLEPEGNTNINWYQCERCNGWAHINCVGDIDESDPYICVMCSTEE